jgi:hypothetical protein
MADTPGAFPIIGDNTTVRFRVGALVTAIAALVGFVVWLTTLHLNQQRHGELIQDIKADVRDIKVDMRRITDGRVGSLP